MAKRNNKITNEGEDFIKGIVDSNGKSLLSGNNGPLPFSDDGNGNYIDKTWTVNAKYSIDPDRDLNENNLADALINWFNEFGNDYDLDPNILAAQAYIESGYNLWWYDKRRTKSGINGFTMPMIYSIIIENFSNIEPLMSLNDISNLNNNLKDRLSSTSYQPVSGNENTKQIARENRGLLHQNIIDNPKTMIKAQARYMRYLSDNCDGLASTSLFCYNKGSDFISNTYSKTIQKYKKDLGIKDNEHSKIKEGLDYVLKTFGVLGDTLNSIKTSFGRTYKPVGYSFGYNNLFITNDNSDLETYPNDNFDPFEANKVESEQYEFSEESLDNLSIARKENYKFIYFPESRYIKDETKKLQIVLHHTVSGGKEDVADDVRYWRDKGENVATSFIVSRTGQIFQLFNTNFWAYHLGLELDYLNNLNVEETNLSLNSKSIGIEIDSWGGLLPGESDEGEGWFPTLMDDDGNLQTFIPKKNAKPINIENVQEYNEENGYPKGFRDFYAFEKYTKAQINAVREIIISLKEKYGDIDLKYNKDMWDINYDENTNPIGSPDGAKGISMNALNGSSGIWTHVSYRKDKSDCHPQPELINMLKSLKS